MGRPTLLEGAAKSGIRKKKKKRKWGEKKEESRKGGVD